MSSGGESIYIATAVLTGYKDAERATYAENVKLYKELGHIFADGGEIQFVVSPTNDSTKKYSFTINTASNFKEMYPFVDASSFNDGLAAVKQLDWGFIDITGCLALS